MKKQSILLLSTVCISKETADCVNNACFEHTKLYDEIVIYEAGMHGWFVSVPDNIDGVTMPDDLRDCMEKAKFEKCNWIMFDRDIDFIIEDGLQKYNW